MVEEFRKAPVENMDEVIYCVNGTYRLLEFLVRNTHTLYISFYDLLMGGGKKKKK